MHGLVRNMKLFNITLSFLLVFVGTASAAALDKQNIRRCTPEDPCGMCQGDCNTSADCEDGLICWQKNRSEEGSDESTVPGCDGESTSTTDWCIDPAASESQSCTVEPLSTIGTCSSKNHYSFIVNSCGDIIGPRVVLKASEAAGHDLNTYTNKTVFSEAWTYYAGLKPDAVILAGDNVYNDYIRDWGKGSEHPFGDNNAVVLADANDAYLKYHGYLTENKEPGPLFYSYLEFLEDKIKDGYTFNSEFQALRAATQNSIHVTWDDHDYLTNDPSNPHLMRREFRKAAIESITGWDRKHFRFGAAHKGIERTWTQEITDNQGNSFLIRFIIIDEETTHYGTQGCQYYYNPESPTGFTPRLATDSSQHCPDMTVIDDFDADPVSRTFFGDDQLAWFKEQLMKPADLIFVLNGGPNFEIDYGYNSLTEFQGEKKKFIKVLRESGAEHVIFLTGDSHASYVTEAPNIVGYPLYTIVGSGLTQGLSYDRYIGFWGDISHRFLVAAGSTNNNNRAASMAEVKVFFDGDNDAIVRFIPHIREIVETDDGWNPWYAQTEPFEDEPWAAQYDIRVSDLEIALDWPRYHYDDEDVEHKFVTESIYFKWANSTGPVTVEITNAKGNSKSFDVESGNCGEGFVGFCKDKWGAFTYAATKVGTYAPSKVNQEMCQHAGYVGDEISWAILEDGNKVTDGSLTLKYQNNILINSDGELEDLYWFGTQAAYKDVTGDAIGVLVTTIINEPPLYGGHTVPVKGWNGSEFEDTDVQAAYEAYMADDSEEKDSTDLQAKYLATYYPDLPQL